MATATKRKRQTVGRRAASSEFVKMPEAAERLGFNRAIIAQMVELGYFTDRRRNPLSDASNRIIFIDEIDRYLELLNDNLPRDRILAAMKQHRAEAGRIPKKAP